LGKGIFSTIAVAGVMGQEYWLGGGVSKNRPGTSVLQKKKKSNGKVPKEFNIQSIPTGRTRTGFLSPDWGYTGEEVEQLSNLDQTGVWLIIILGLVWHDSEEVLLLEGSIWFPSWDDCSCLEGQPQFPTKG
jgi:hypothetical protein